MTTLDECLKDVAVLGAAGKMGKGISLVLLQEITYTEAVACGKVGTGNYRLHLIDTNEEALEELPHYLKDQLLRFAEKNIGRLREAFASNPELVSNEEMVRAFVEGGLANIRPAMSFLRLKKCHMVFEAVAEDLAIKTKVYQSLKESCPPNCYFLSNTSSIPIEEINQCADLDNRVIGFHFYNPPPVQKLVELISGKHTNSELVSLSEELVKRLKKIVVPSNDIAGFIGNGHFMRDVQYACEKVQELIDQGHECHEALYLVNRVTQDYMIRPMGIFQLLDYVGVDICKRIFQVMTEHTEGKEFGHPLIDQLLSLNVKGGQNTDGSQRNGILQYEKGAVIGVYDCKTKDYCPVKGADWAAKCDEELGALPEGHHPWKLLLKDKVRGEKLGTYFQHLFEDSSLGARLARDHLLNSKEIAHRLVEDGIAQNVDDVNAVLQNGFYHLYGPVNSYF